MGEAQSKPPRQGYDCVVELLSFDNVIKGTGWPVKWRRPIAEWCTNITAFIGQEKRGKTHILGKITKQPSLCGLASDSDHTLGLSATYLDDRTVILDTAGLYTAVTGANVVTEEMIKVHELTENFRLAVQLELSKQVVVVFGSFSRLDQKLLWEVARYCSAGCGQQKPLYVIANFASVSDPGDFATLQKEVAVKLNAVPDKEKIGRSGVEIEYFHLPPYLCKGRLVCLGNDNGNLASQNELVYTALRQWIAANKDLPVKCKSPLDPVLAAMNSHLPHFFVNPGVRAQYTPCTHNISVVADTKPLQLKDLIQGKVDEGEGSKTVFTPPIRVETTKQAYTIRVLLPAVNCSDFKVQYVAGNNITQPEIKVSGKRNKVTTGEDLNVIKDTVDYGSFSESFKIMGGYSNKFTPCFSNGELVITCPLGEQTQEIPVLCQATPPSPCQPVVQ
eukprot:TRINITY_DN580_c0_g1_i10.p1 TRINITY_DN580_c0_g1~~TRINITY_DN580_c0_g1_i10.p1  ORF type:complete len:446 (-),score=86.37 TRINITY_DN580_c0_g1_i10:57-1394(-)